MTNQVGDHEVNRDEWSRAETPKLAQPLVRREEIRQHRHRVNTRNVSAHPRRLDPVAADRLLVLLAGYVREVSHPVEASDDTHRLGATLPLSRRMPQDFRDSLRQKRQPTSRVQRCCDSRAREALAPPARTSP